ncbi:hypothetical protein [Mycetocola sp. 2940]|uniref:hypothetical protein n=1 Tax=Mycetocola sp. 2940 TaxID=3156452 RepID=UPI003394503C
MPIRSTTQRAALSSVILAVALAGCSPVEATPTEAPVASATPTPRPSKAPCMEITPSLLAELNRVVAAKGDGATVPGGTVVFDEETGLWHVGGIIDDPRNTDGYLAVWATVDDPSVEPFVGKLFATPLGAAEGSISEVTDEAQIDVYGPERIGACLNQVSTKG